MKPDFQEIEALGAKLGRAALIAFVQLCPEARTATPEKLEAACAAMRAKGGDAYDQLIKDAKDAPWMAQIAFNTAVLTLAHEGIKVMRSI
jgi:hypothetical protein